MKSTEHAIYRQADSLGGVELLQASYVRTNFPRHVHEGYCIALIEQGAQRFYRDGAEHLAPEGSIVLVNSDQVHTGRSGTDKGWRYRAIYPTPNDLSSMMREMFGPGQMPWFRSSVVKNPYLSQCLRNLLNSLEDTSNPLFSETLYQEFFRLLAKEHGLKNASTNDRLLANPPAVERIKSYLESHFSEPVTLEELASVAGLNKSYLTRLFTRHTGLPPHSYLIQIRVRHAKHLLRQGLSLADVASATGFTDQSHLHRHFQRTLGVSPGRYSKYLH